jgi:hypothetical protein
MKKITIIAIALISLSSCSTAPLDKSFENSHRIIGKEYHVVEGYGYQIIEVDGVEYIAMTGGGICPLVKDTIK